MNTDQDIEKDRKELGLPKSRWACVTHTDTQLKFLEEKGGCKAITHKSANAFGEGYFAPVESIQYEEAFVTARVNYPLRPTIKVIDRHLVEDDVAISHLLSLGGKWYLFFRNCDDKNTIPTQVFLALVSGDWILFIAPTRLVKCVICYQIEDTNPNDSTSKGELEDTCELCKNIVQDLQDPDSRVRRVLAAMKINVP